MGVDCGVMCLMILEKRLNGSQTWDIKPDDEFNVENCRRTRARMVSHFLRVGDRHITSPETLAQEDAQAKKDQESLEKTRKKSEKNLDQH